MAEPLEGDEAAEEVMPATAVAVTTAIVAGTDPEPAPEPAPPGGRAIVLFSDGTGNSSGKLFKTNVWRMYEAVDLGPVEGDKRKQIAFYDNGVGTSGFRPLALLAGIFGFGLRRNILEIYRYACRNYRPADGQVRGEEPLPGGDAIYGFGFSRGAFTIRLVIALIASQGLVVTRDEAELDRLSRDAYRAFRATFLPRNLQGPTRLWRWVRGLVIDGYRRLRGRAVYDVALNYKPDMPFVGVWDTVAAYGGPIVEITRGIDNWLYALSMPDYCLSPRVKCARHALAIDDARDAFHPLLWDEVNEARLMAERKVAKGRLQQVWFTGMHADVGGGYPDESLSFVSFLWMLQEAEDAGLRTLEVVTERFRALANSAGPVHDSRAGFGAYYRYQPRNIAAWLDGCDPQSIIADPHLRHADGRQKGLLKHVRVHESVAARIADGTDRYAPFNLPANLIVIPGERGEMLAQPDSQTPQAPPPRQQPAQPMISDDLRAMVTDPVAGALRVAALQPVWDRVWLRRGLYFTTLALTVLLVAMPLWIGFWFDPPFLADGRTWAGGLIRLLTVVTPGMTHPLIETAADNSFWFGVLVGAIVALQVCSTRLDRRMRQDAREVWRAAIGQLDAADVTPGGPLDGQQGPSWIQRLRTSRWYRLPLRALKWHLLPALAALALVLVLAWAALGTYTQLRLPGMERGTTFCPRRSAMELLDTSVLDLATDAKCVTSHRLVRRGTRYSVTLEVAPTEQWWDGEAPATPRGLAAGALGWAGYAGVPFRRVISERYLQPLIAVRRGPGDLQLWDRVHIEPLMLRQSVNRPNVWRGSFTAARTGELVMFVNEAVPPWGAVDWFYKHPLYGNRGRATVTIRRTDRPASNR